MNGGGYTELVNGEETEYGRFERVTIEIQKGMLFIFLFVAETVDFTVRKLLLVSF